MLFAELKKIKRVFILHCKFCLMTVFCQGCFIKVCLICHIPLKCACFKLVYQNIFCPSKLLCCLDVKFTLDIVFTTLYDNDVLRPTDFSHQWCEFFIFLIGNVKISHSPEIGAGKPMYSRKLLLQVSC